MRILQVKEHMLFRHSSIYILAKLIPGLMAFAALSLYTHLLSPDEYGVYTLIFSGAVLLHNVVFNWLPAGTLRFWSNNEFENNTFINTLAFSYIRIIGVLFALALIGLLIFWNKPEATWIINAFLLLLALALFAITQTLFSAQIQPLNFAFLTISYSILALGFGVGFAYLGYGASGVITGITIGTLLPALFVFKRIWLPFKKNNYNKELFTKLLTYGLPLAAAALVEEITKVSDRFMLAILQDKSQAGFYAAGYDLSGNSILMIMAAINLAAYPVIIKLLETDGMKVAMKYFHQYIVLLLGVSIPAVVGLNLVGGDLVYLLIAEEYQPAVIFLLPWVSSAIFLLGLQVFYFDLAFQLGNRTISSVKIAVIIAVINIGLNYWLIPTMGIKGAAIATISSFSVGSILSAIIGRQCFKLPFPWSDFFKIVFSSLVMGFCLWWLKDFRGWGWLILQLVVGGTSYLIMMVVFNILDIRSNINNFLKRA